MKSLWITAAVTALLDGGSKLLAHIHLQNQTISLGSLLHLQFAENTGMALGLLSGGLWPLILPPVIIIIGFFALRNIQHGKLGWISIGMITGGFLGNWVERLIRGCVTDMIFFPWMPFFICNIADIAICIGAALLLADLWFGRQA